MSAHLAAALVQSLDEAALRDLAAALSPYLPLAPDAGEDRWMDTREAAAYLGVSTSTLHKWTAARRVPFSQDTPGGCYWFQKSELDAWRRG